MDEAVLDRVSEEIIDDGHSRDDPVSKGDDVSTAPHHMVKEYELPLWSFIERYQLDIESMLSNVPLSRLQYRYLESEHTAAETEANQRISGESGEAAANTFSSLAFSSSMSTMDHVMSGDEISTTLTAEVDSIPANVSNSYSGLWTGVRDKVYNETIRDGSFTMDLKTVKEDMPKRFHFVEVC